ncbi:peptidase G2 autoproteolytic cleavage domain-containing protein [Halalkalibacter lacteus]
MSDQKEIKSSEHQEEEVQAQEIGTLQSPEPCCANGCIITDATNGCSVAEGRATTASGLASHAEGRATTASGPRSHAEGRATTASGARSHAEGQGTTASGNDSHAEGNTTTAGGNASHAEGRDTQAFGENSHVEGRNTTTGDAGDPSQGLNAHAEGEGNTATGRASHAEGGAVDQFGDPAPTLASGDSSHAEGVGTTASGFATHAEGTSTTASGTASHAEGNSTTASGPHSHAEGTSTTASGNASHAEGISNTASGNFSHTEGVNTAASGEASHAEGLGTIASGRDSHAEGIFTTASGFDSHAEGIVTIASGSASHAEGAFTTASGNASHAEGFGTNTAGFDGAHIMGQFGDAEEEHSWFIGNGTDDDNRALGAKWLASSGNMFIDGTFVSGGADYAEMFETADGNSINVGYFVTFDGANDKIRKANKDDTYIVGVTSTSPGLIGDSGEMRWKDKFVTDKWGRVQRHEVTVPAQTDKTGNVIIAERKEIQPILNPDWDPKIEYVSRLKRPEWVTVGLLGKVLVRDDGSCQVGGYCRPNDEGIATTSSEGYRVMMRTEPDQILVLLNSQPSRNDLDPVVKLEKLAKLKEQDFLTEEEFNEQKQKLLHS